MFHENVPNDNVSISNKHVNIPVPWFLERSFKSPLLDEMERKSKGIVGEMGPEPVCSLSFSYRLFGTTLKQLGQVGSLEA